MVMLREWSVERRENGYVTEVVNLRENGHVTEVVTLMEGKWSCDRGGQFGEGEWSYYGGGQFNGGKMIMLQRWIV